MQVVWIIDAPYPTCALVWAPYQSAHSPRVYAAGPSYLESSMHSTITEASRACLISYGTLYGHMLVVAREKLPTQEAESEAVVHVFDGYLGFVLGNVYDLPSSRRNNEFGQSAT